MIAGTYEKLAAIYEATKKVSEAASLGDDRDRVAALDGMRQAFAAFAHFYEPRRIYIPKATREKIRVSVNVMQNFVLNANIFAAMRNTVNNSDILKDREEKIDNLREKIPALFEALEDDFQTVLGFPAPEIAKGEPESAPK